MRNIVENIKQIRLEKRVTQEVLADALGVDTAVISNIEKGKRELKVSELEIISNCLSVDMLYLITYPDVYVKRELASCSGEKVSVTFEVDASQKEYLLRLVTGKQ